MKKLIYPVCVFFVNGEFFAHVPSVGEADEFCDNYIQSNNLPVDATEVFMYDRKEWIALLRDVKQEKLKFVIENNRVCTYKAEDAEEDIEVDIDWMKEDDLEGHYTAEEITKINENRVFLQDISFLTEEVMASLPHKITSKKRTVKAKVKKDVLVSELLGVKHVKA